MVPHQRGQFRSDAGLPSAFIGYLRPTSGRELGAPPQWSGLGRRVGLAVAWTLSDVLTPAGRRVHDRVLRIAVPWDGRAVPLLQVAADRYHIPAGQSQNSLEEHALLAVPDALPPGTRPVVLAARGFARDRLFAALRARGVDFVIRVRRGTRPTEPDGRGWKLGSEGAARGRCGGTPGCASP
ncbi:MAG TPA: hypothetical protein VH482_20945 [Thermomicrobiales bacterium]|jgi:hypothetical protein